MIGKSISHFKIIEKIGAGGMGEVYLAEDTELDRKVALKFLPPHYSSDSEIIERFKREAKAAASLNHPNIITVHEVGEHEGQTFIAMEYVEGSSLRDLMAEGELPLAQILDIGGQICEGLAKAHQADIVHRDIKPENTMIDRDGRVRILDFGLAKLKGVTKLTSASSTLGTLNYMSPEQLQGMEVDHRTDIWSVGVVFYEMLTRQLPFQGEYEASLMYSVMNEEPESLPAVRPEIPAALEQIVNKALAKNPEERYQQVGQLLADLGLGDDSGAEPATGKRPKDAQTSNRRVFKFIAPVFVVLLVISAILYFSGPRAWIAKVFQGDESLIGISDAGRTSLAVMYFDNLTGNPELDIWERGTAELLINELAGHPKLAVLDPQSMYFLQAKYKGDAQNRNSEALALELVSNIDASVVVFGQLFQSSDHLNIRVKLIEVENRSVLGTDELIVANKNEILASSETLAEKIISHLGVKQLEGTLKQSQATHLVTQTKSIAAYEYFLKAQQHLNNNNMNLCISELSNAVAADSTYVGAYFVLTMMHLNMGNRPKAARLLELARNAIPSPSVQDELLLAAIAASIEPDYGRLARIQRQYLGQNPGDRGIMFNLGVTYNGLGEYTKAYRYLEKVYSSHWRMPFVYYQLALAYHYTEQYERELKIYEKGAQDFPGNPSWHTLPVRTYIVRGKSKEAQTAIAALLEKASELGWPLPYVYSDIASSYLEVSELEPAREYLLKALEVDSLSGQAWYGLAQVELKQRNLGEVDEYISRIKKHHPKSPRHLILRGQVALQEGAYSDAKNYFQQIIERFPYLDEAHFGLAQALEQMGQDEQALTSYRYFLWHTYLCPDRQIAIDRVQALKRKLALK